MFRIHSIAAQQPAVQSWTYTDPHRKLRYHFCSVVVPSGDLTNVVEARLRMISLETIKRPHVQGYEDSVAIRIDNATTIVMFPGSNGQKTTIAQESEFPLGTHLGKERLDQLMRTFVMRLEESGLLFNPRNLSIPDKYRQQFYRKAANR